MRRIRGEDHRGGERKNSSVAYMYLHMLWLDIHEPQETKITWLVQCSTCTDL